MSDITMYQCWATKDNLVLFDKANPALQTTGTVAAQLAVPKGGQEEIFKNPALFAKYANDGKNQVAIFFPSTDSLLDGTMYIYEVSHIGNGIEAGGIYLFDYYVDNHHPSPFVPASAKTNPEGYAVGKAMYIDFDGDLVPQGGGYVFDFGPF